MVYSDDTTTTLDTDNQDDKMIFLSGREVREYFGDENIPSGKPLKKNRRSFAAYVKKLFE